MIPNRIFYRPMTMHMGRHGHMSTHGYTNVGWSLAAIASQLHGEHADLDI